MVLPLASVCFVQNASSAAPDPASTKQAPTGLSFTAQLFQPLHTVLESKWRHLTRNYNKVAQEINPDQGVWWVVDRRDLPSDNLHCCVRLIHFKRHHCCTTKLPTAYHQNSATLNHEHQVSRRVRGCIQAANEHTRHRALAKPQQSVHFKGGYCRTCVK